jgi:hypothetical protein
MTNTVGRILIAGFLAVVPAIVPAIAQSAGTIRVCVADDDKAPTLVLLRAEMIASRMFATAGVTVEWRSRGDASCRETLRSDIVSIEFVTNTPAAYHPGALAYARPYQGSEIVVMFDRVERSARPSSQVSNVLAHVLAHEITHLLQGITRHSETGVMKARWRQPDFDLMAYHRLQFTPEDIELIRRGLAQRGESFAVAALVAAEASR